MEKIDLFFEKENIDVKSEIIDKYLSSVDDKLKNNPSFISELYSAIRHLTQKNPNGLIPSLELYISDDGKGFELRGKIRKNPNCINDLLQNNKCYEQFSFDLDDKNVMSVTMLTGTLYKFDDFMKIGAGSLADKFKIFNEHDTPTVLSVFHRNKQFLENGVEVSNSTYSDQYPIGITMDNEKEIKVQTVLYHAPKKWYFNLVPGEPEFEFNPLRSNAHRFSDSLGIIEYQIKSGKDGQVRGYEYLSSTEYPERLGGNPTPLCAYVDGKKEYTQAYLESYPGKSEQEIVKQLEISFAKGIEFSKTKEINPEAYEGIKNMAFAGLEKRYGININNPEVIQGINK